MTEAEQAETVSTEHLLFGDMEVRWFQAAAKNSVEDELERGTKRILVVHPTGAGKTITSGLIFSSERVRRAVGIENDRPLRLLFIAHTHRLLTQAERTYADAANVELIPHSAFQDLPQDLDWDITCIDEAHHEAMQTVQYHLEQLGDRPIIGLTATPERPDNCVIKFSAIVDPISREQAVEEGFIAPTYINSILDSSEKNKTQIITDIINSYGDQFGQTMVFVKTKNEVRQVSDHLNRCGYKTVALTNQSKQEVNNILDRFSNGDIQFIVNCNKINEGVDVKGCTDVILGRQFGSYPQLNQVIGRASRPDSDCVVWELINPLSGRNLDTTAVVGTPNDHRLISQHKGQWVEQQFDYVSSIGSAKH